MSCCRSNLNLGPSCGILGIGVVSTCVVWCGAVWCVVWCGAAGGREVGGRGVASGALSMVTNAPQPPSPRAARCRLRPAATLGGGIQVGLTLSIIPYSIASLGFIHLLRDSSRMTCGGLNGGRGVCGVGWGRIGSAAPCAEHAAPCGVHAAQYRAHAALCGAHAAWLQQLPSPPCSHPPGRRAGPCGR